MSKISVIIPVYNVEKYLCQCLDSVINQTLKDIEIICVEDFSSDKSLSILKEYALKDSRFKVLTQKHKGAGSARNLGLKHSTGEYLYFMDADDYIELNALEKIYKRITETNAEICVFKNGVYHQSTGILDSCNWEHSILNIPDKETFNKYDIPNVFFQFCNIPVWAKMYKASFIKDNEIKFQSLKTCNDVYFNYISLILADSITFLNETLLTWRTGHSCTTATRGKYVHCTLKAYKAIKDKLSKEDFELLSDSFYKRVNSSFIYEIGKINKPRKRDYWTLKLYKFLPKKYWATQAINLKKAKREKRKNFLRNIFSIRNVGIHKVFCILGIKFKIKSQKLVEKEQYIAKEELRKEIKERI